MSNEERRNTMSDEGRCDCREFLRRQLAAMGLEAHVTDVPPIIPSPYEDLGLRCPHGVRWYAEPTGKQRAQWATDGVA